jgi:hypothetical protein
MAMVERQLAESISSPLLPVGVYPTDLNGLRRLCVEYFPGSAVRPAMMAAITQIIGVVNTASIPARIWIGGAFMSEADEPEDFSLSLIVTESVFTAMTSDQRSVFDWIRTASLFENYRGENYAIVIDETRADGEWLSAYWLRQLMGTPHDDKKGIAEILVPFLQRR